MWDQTELRAWWYAPAASLKAWELFCRRSLRVGFWRNVLFLRARRYVSRCVTGLLGTLLPTRENGRCAVHFCGEMGGCSVPFDVSCVFNGSISSEDLERLMQTALCSNFVSGQEGKATSDKRRRGDASSSFGLAPADHPVFA